MAWVKENLDTSNFGVPAVTFVPRSGGGNLHIFTKQKDGTMEVKQNIENEWEKAQKDVDEWYFKGGFSAVSRQDTQFDVIGIDYFNNVMHLSCLNEVWKSWTPVGAGIFFTGTPALSRMNDNRMDAFAIGNFCRIYHNVWTKTTGWSSWQAISEDFGSTVVAAAASSNTTCDVFTIDDEGKIRTKRFTINTATNLTTWGLWSTIDTGSNLTMLFNMTAISTSPNKISLFSIASDLNLYQCRINMFGVWKWTKIQDGPFIYGVDAICHLPEKITVIAGSTNSKLNKIVNF